MREKSKSAEGFADLATQIDAGSPLAAAHNDFSLLADRLDAVARLRNDAIAVVDGQRRMSYRELLLRADALARDLVAPGIGPRDLVAIALPRSAELIVAVVGIV